MNIQTEDVNQVLWTALILTIKKIDAILLSFLGFSGGGCIEFHLYPRNKENITVFRSLRISNI